MFTNHKNFFLEKMQGRKKKKVTFKSVHIATLLCFLGENGQTYMQKNSVTFHKMLFRNFNFKIRNPNFNVGKSNINFEKSNIKFKKQINFKIEDFKVYDDNILT